MAFGWDDLILLGATAYSAYTGNKAADAQGDASNRAIAEQQRQYNLGLNLLEPQRMAGYQALGDLSTLYGWATPGYQSANQLLGGIPSGGGGGSNIGVGSASGNEWYNKGLMGSFGPASIVNALGFGGRKDPQVSVRNGMVYFDGRRDGGTLYGGHINPVTGEVWVDRPGTTNRDPALSEQATAALRSGQPLEGGPWGRFNLAYNQLAGTGWKYNQAQTPEGMAAGGLGPKPAGQSSFERFYTSPDYQFRLQEGTKAVENSAAARGGAMSGNAVRAGTDYASGLAAGEFNNYVSRLMQAAGFGSAATSQAVNTGQQTAANIGNLYGNIGNARASGYAAQNNAVQGGLQNWMFNRYLQGNTGGSGYQVPSDIRNFQYPFDAFRG